MPPLPPGGLPPLGKPAKEKGFASRFMKRLGSRKERFQGRELAHLQPARDEDDMTGNVKQSRSLASKLLWNFIDGITIICTIRSPGGTPLGPGKPFPSTFIWKPLSTPGGILISIGWQTSPSR